MRYAIDTHRAGPLPDDWLDGFDRLQETERVLAWADGRLTERESRFVNDWSADERRAVVASLGRCLDLGGVVVCATGPRPGEIIGFANVEPEPFGPGGMYRELSYLHVSRPHRGRGIGAALFRPCLAEAARLGAAALYIGTHPSVDTQRFYRSVGCVPARYTHEPIFAREPRDIQLECAAVKRPLPSPP